MSAPTDAEPNDRPFATIERYWSDPAFAARHDAERDAWRRDTNVLIDAAIARNRAKGGGL